MSQKLKQRAIRDRKSEFLTKAYSLVYEAIKRTLKITPFDVQLQAAISMANGDIIELPTGEGKTVVAVFVAYLKGLIGDGVHIFTFNDFLAKRDAQWMKPAYNLLGVSVDFICQSKTMQERKQAYNADVTYVTIKEAGYDYMRSFLVYDENHIVQRKLNVAIVDEADSIMIDNARVPLIIAGDADHKIPMDIRLYEIISQLDLDVHLLIDHYAKTVTLTDSGYQFLEEQIGGDLYSLDSIEILIQINLLLRAEFLLKRDVDYIIKDNEIFIIDEFTGRIMDDCKWPDGIQAAVELKEGLSIGDSEPVINRITIQNYLNLYPCLCGMTGTAISSSREFFEFFQKKVELIAPNRPCIRIDHPDVVFSSRKAKNNAIIEKINEIHKTGRPILVGTGSIRESEELAEKLRKSIPTLQVLNAKNDLAEAAIISDAGTINAVTISTNMAGRGVDIRLGGIHGKQYDQVAEKGGLFVIGTNRHDSVRIDNQLRGRSGRQGDPGETVFYLSLYDDLFVKHNMKEIIPTQYNNSSNLPISQKKDK